jgi:atypical dual specificity phosphatase
MSITYHSQQSAQRRRIEMAEIAAKDLLARSLAAATAAGTGRRQNSDISGETEAAGESESKDGQIKGQQWIPFDSQTPVGPSERVFGDVSEAPNRGSDSDQPGSSEDLLAPVFLASQFGATSQDVFDALGIRAVINITTGSQKVANAFEGDVERNVEYVNFEVHDQPGASLSEAFRDAIPRIKDWKRAKKPTLVHCQAGLSRSAAVVVALRMDLHRERLSEAVAFVEARRGRRLQINPSFWMDLAALERELFALPAGTPPSLDFAPWWVEGFGNMGVSEDAVRRSLSSPAADWVNFEAAFSAMFS